MGRKRINDEETLARFPGGTLERVDAVLRKKEKRAEFFREAVERELRRREGMSARKAAK
jgi:metal-responsive CopG/Arc/MetJ family transcriptional regulator